MFTKRAIQLCVCFSLCTKAAYAKIITLPTDAAGGEDGAV